MCASLLSRATRLLPFPFHVALDALVEKQIIVKVGARMRYIGTALLSIGVFHGKLGTAKRVGRRSQHIGILFDGKTGEENISAQTFTYDYMGAAIHRKQFPFELGWFATAGKVCVSVALPVTSCLHALRGMTKRKTHPTGPRGHGGSTIPGRFFEIALPHGYAQYVAWSGLHVRRKSHK